MTIGEALLEQMDSTIDPLGIGRSAFVREPLQQAMEHYRIVELERQHAVGYARKPVEPGEFDVWEAEQSRRSP